MKYGVNFTYVERGYAEIEADDKDEAIDLSEDAIAGGRVIWETSDVTEANATPIEPKTIRDYER